MRGALLLTNHNAEVSQVQLSIWCQMRYTLIPENILDMEALDKFSIVPYVPKYLLLKEEDNSGPPPSPSRR